MRRESMVIKEVSSCTSSAVDRESPMEDAKHLGRGWETSAGNSGDLGG